jgi:hypothetical protein
MNIKDTANEIIQTAKKYLSVDEDGCSSGVGYFDALSLYEEGDYGHAIARALTSLSYSVGMIHSAYKQALWLSKNISEIRKYEMANTISGLLKERCVFINKAMHNHGNMKKIGKDEMKDILHKINQYFDEIENLITPYIYGGCKFNKQREDKIATKF